MAIHKSSEDYLETILILTNKLGLVRNIDIAEYMNYSKPSVTNAINVLKNGGYVEFNENKHIILTDKGKDVAEKIYEKHNFFKEYFISIGVDEETATNDACRIEHAISDESFEKLKKNISK